jgi:hypothetical protein
MTLIEHSISIRCTARALYDYVTQPWRWHEWHPTSKSATATTAVLQVGDTYTEIIELQPFGFLPLRIRRQLDYVVLIAEPHREWAVRASSRGSVMNLRYRFEPIAEGVQFTRTLSYEISGPVAVLGPFLARQNRRISAIALANLTRSIESGRVAAASATSANPETPS